MPEDPISGHRNYGSLKANLKNLLPYFKRHWRQALMGSLFIAAATLLAFAPPLISRYIVDDVIVGRQVDLLTGAILLLFGCLAVEKLSRLFEEFYFARFEQNVTLDIQEGLIEKILRLPKSFFDDKQTGYLQSRLTEDIDGIRWFFSSTIVHAISSALRFLGGIVFLFYLQWKLSIAVLILLPGLVWMIRFISGKNHLLSHHIMEHKAEVSGQVQESLSEVILIKSTGNEDRARIRLMSAVGKVFQRSLEQRVITSLAGIAINAMPGLARISTLALGAVWIINGQWTIGSLLAFQAYLAYVFGPAQFLASSNFQFQKALAALERVSAIFNIVPEDNVKAGCMVNRLKGDIEFRNVSFSYNGYEPVLKNISFHICAGERLALVGPSGIGKTTLMSLILRFYRTTAGEIYFDGRPASGYNAGALRRRIGYASQNPNIMTGTILENLRYGEPEADRDLIVHAAKTAAIHDEIEKLPQKYETIIGPKGLNLSEGQKQRLSIARALIINPDILILDEPTAALDSTTEKSIFDALPAQINDKTMLVASHRLSTIKHANRILLLNENGVADIGTHESLQGCSDYYRSMVANQETERALKKTG